MDFFLSHVEMANKCVCLGIGTFKSGYDCYDHEDRKVCFTRGWLWWVTQFEWCWIQNIDTCDIINIVDNDNLQEVKTKDNGEVNRVLVKNCGDYQLYRVSQTCTRQLHVLKVSCLEITSATLRSIKYLQWSKMSFTCMCE